MYVCLWSPDWSTAAASAAEGDDGPSPTYGLAPLLAEHAPRLRVEAEVIWADGRGLDAAALAGRLLERLAAEGVTARAGVAAVPVTAELAARWGPHPEADPAGSTPFLVKERTGWGRRRGTAAASHPARETPHPAPPPEGGANGWERPPRRTVDVVAIERGCEGEWQAALPIAALRPEDRIRALFDGVGLKTVGDLAALEREAVEVRFGGGVVALWRAARADHRRLLFDRIPSDRPHGSLDFVDYVLTDPTRLLFTANALLGPLCSRLTERGEHARTLRLELPLANGDAWARTLRPARPTADRETWLRLIRGLLDELTVPDAVVGMRIEVPSTEAAAVRQGDLFDRGFATASAVEAAVARLAERQLWPVVPETDADPVIERRGSWKRQELTDVANAHRGEGGGPGGEGGEPGADGPGAGEGGAPKAHDGSGRGGGGHPQRRGLTLQLMPEPRRITVETRRRRDHEAPIRFRDRTGWREVAHAAGPDRISGGQWEASSYAREYWRCVTGEGVPLWIYRDALDGAWYLHGWWD